MKSECPVWAPPLLAIQFLTRLPVPGVARLSEEGARIGLSRAVAWFPLIGALIGTITAATMLLAEQVWPRLVAVLLALAVEARLTGAFHEDAVADFCDGVGGGRDPAHARQIMKDSRIGSFGAVGLTLGIALRAALMYSLDSALATFAIIAASTFGRLLAVISMAITPPAPSAAIEAAPAARPNAEPPRAADHKPAAASGTVTGNLPARSSLAKSVTSNMRPSDVALAFVTALPGLIPLAFISPSSLAFAALAGLAFTLWFRPFLVRHVGGSTGDCLGFAAYVGQLLLLLAATAA